LELLAGFGIVAAVLWTGYSPWDDALPIAAAIGWAVVWVIDATACATGSGVRRLGAGGGEIAVAPSARPALYYAG